MAEPRYDEAQEFTNIILCCPVCQTNDEGDEESITRPIECNNCDTIYALGGVAIDTISVATELTDEPFTGAIVFCPLSGDQFDATRWGLNEFHCTCNADFRIYLIPSTVRQHSMFG